MKSNKTNQIIVVLGSGRSGTSLLMQILEAFGMSTSTDMIPSKEQTPTGAYEDREIFQIQNEFIGSITPHSMPMPQDWDKHKNFAKTIRQLKKIIADRINDSSTIFGFKDPKTSMLIPMWTRIFNEMNLTPKYILTVRNPQSVITSMQRQYSTNPIVSELFWLTRYTEALYNCGSNCFIVHYEDWFSNKAHEVADKLLEFAGLTNYVGNSNVDKILETVVRPNLNRAVYNDYEVKNRYILQLHEQLQQCRGDNFDHHGLMDVVMGCRKAMGEFSGWAIEAQRFFSQREKNKNNEVTVIDNDLKKPVLETNKYLQERDNDLKKSVLETNKYIQECMDLSDENENLRIKTSVQAKDAAKYKQELNRKSRDIERNKKNLFSLQTSTSFQVGQILVNAIAKPGKNTILFPFYLLRLALASRIVKNK